jgi:hypothetical protein
MIVIHKDAASGLESQKQNQIHDYLVEKSAEETSDTT